MARRILNAQTTNLTVESFGMEGGPQSQRQISVSGTIGTGVVAVNGRAAGSGAPYQPVRTRRLGDTTGTWRNDINALGNWVIEDAGALDIQYVYTAAGGSSLTLWEQEHA